MRHVTVSASSMMVGIIADHGFSPSRPSPIAPHPVLFIIYVMSLDNTGTDCQHTSGTTNTTSILPRQTDVMIVGDVHEYNSRAESGNIGGWPRLFFFWVWRSEYPTLIDSHPALLRHMRLIHRLPLDGLPRSYSHPCVLPCFRPT